MGITLEMIEEIWKQDWDAAKAEFGDAFKVPSEVSAKISEKHRALHVILSHGGESPVSAMRHFQVSADTIEWVANEVLGVEVDVEAPVAPKPKLADKYDALDEWAKTHPGEQVAPDGLVDLSGLSYASVMKYLKDTPRYKKVKNGVYEAFFDQPK